MCKQYFDNKLQSHDIISRVAFLIGVKECYFTNENYSLETEIYNALALNQSARVIRNLCVLRTVIEQNFPFIKTQMLYEFKHIDSVEPDSVRNCIERLRQDEITIPEDRQIENIIIALNGFIDNKIDACKELFPDWVKWEYIKQLFMMPGGDTFDGVTEEGKKYQESRLRYPYQMYIGYLPNLKKENILYNDSKFLSIIYQYHGDSFGDFKMVENVGKSAKDTLTNFLFKNEETAIFVDCENSDATKACSLLNYLEQEGLADKITLVALYNDKNTGVLWQYLDKCTALPVEHRMTRRVKVEKSLVDIQLSVGLCREHYSSGCKSFILLSSDSDYCGLISEMPDADFLVMTEYGQCSDRYCEALDELGAEHCDLDSFCGDGNALLMTALADAATSKINRILGTINLLPVLDELCRESFEEMNSEQKQSLIEEYWASIRFEITGEGCRALLPRLETKQTS